MAKQSKIAVVGCGYWGRNHARTLASLGALGAVVDRNRETASEIAIANGCPVATIDEVLADSSIDGVIFALPPQHHPANALRAIEAGKHVLVEKPIALTVEDGEKIVAAGEEKGVVVMTGHILRFHPAFEKLEALIAEGELGSIRYIHSHRLGLGKFHTENDALWDIAPHDLSLIMALTGEEPSHISGEGSAVLDHLSDFAHLHLSFPSGIRSHIFASRLNPYRERRLTVIGDKAMATFDDAVGWNEKLSIYRHKVWKERHGWEFETANQEFIPVKEDMPLTNEISHFIDCIENGTKPRTPASDGLAVIRILSQGTVTHD